MYFFNKDLKEINAIKNNFLFKLFIYFYKIKIFRPCGTFISTEEFISAFHVVREILQLL